MDFVDILEASRSVFGSQNRGKINTKLEENFDRCFDAFLIENRSQMGGLGSSKIVTFWAHLVISPKCSNLGCPGCLRESNLSEN